MTKKSAKGISAIKKDPKFEKMKYVVKKFEEYGVDRGTIINYLLAYHETSNGYLPKNELTPFSDQEKMEEQNRLQLSVNVLRETYGFPKREIESFLSRYASRKYLSCETCPKGLESKTTN